MLENRGLPKQRLRLGEEVRHRLHPILWAEHELLLAVAHPQDQVDARVAGEVANERRELADDAGAFVRAMISCTTFVFASA